MNKVAIVILNWNGAGMLRRFLPSVIRWSSETGVKIYVADNGSTDDSLLLLRREFPQVAVVELQENYGFAEGYNQALSRIAASYYILLNSDVEVTEGWLQPMVDYLDAHPETAACQPKILSWTDKSRFEHAGAAGGFLDRYGYPFCRGRIMEATEPDKGQYDSIVPVFWATGAALFIRADEYHAAGGLDGRFFAHMEEIDLCWRLRARGKELVCIPQSTVYHLGGGTLAKENPRKTFLNFRNNLLMLYKNLPQQELAGVMAFRFFADYLAAALFLMKGEFKNGLAVYRARKAYRRLRREFTPDREANLTKTILNPLPGRWGHSILLAYYLFRIKKFAELTK